MRDALKLGCALAIGIAIAFPAGLMVSSRQSSAGRPQPTAAAERRQMFSPVVTRDPYFLQQQRENIAALERQCRETGALCHEARQARAWLERQAGGG